MIERTLRTVLTLALATGVAGLAAGTVEVSGATNSPSPPLGHGGPELPRVSLDTKDPIVSDRRVACTVGIVHPKGGGPA